MVISLLLLAASRTESLATYCYNISSYSHNCEYEHNTCMDACILWQIIGKPAKCTRNCTTQCFPTSDKVSKFLVVKDKASDDKTPQWLILPANAVTGLEDPARPASIWEDAWALALKGLPPMEKIVPAASIGMAINPGSYRSQHQMHVHIARMNEYMRKALDAKYVPSDRWGHLNITTLYSEKCPSPKHSIENMTLQVRFFPGKTILEIDPFKQVSEMVGEHDMLNHGIILAGSSNGDGFFLATGRYLWSGGQLCTRDTMATWPNPKTCAWW